MKKFINVCLVLAVAMFFGVVNVHADDLEISGHVNSGVGYQRYKNAITPVGYNGLMPGVIGPYVAFAAKGNKQNDFRFFVEEVELDVAKAFGENVRTRVDLDIGDANLGSTRFTAGGSIAVEQAYATANVPAGNGVEFLFGRFNAPFGFEAVDVNDLNTISHTAFYGTSVRPDTLTGLKLYYPFTDAVDFHFYVVNDLTDDATDDTGTTADSQWPSAGFRLGYTFGDDGHANTVGVSAAAGNENTPGAGSEKISMLGDLDFNYWVNDSFAVGGEALYRIQAKAVGTATDGKYLVRLLNLHYIFDDKWDGTFRYSFTNDISGGSATASSGALTGANQKIHELALAGGYTIADGAMLKLEGNYLQSAVKAAADPSIWGFAGMFAYNF